MKTIKIPTSKLELNALLDSGEHDFIDYLPGDNVINVCNYLLGKSVVDLELLSQLEPFFNRSLMLLGRMSDSSHDYNGKLKPYPCIPLYVDQFLEYLLPAIKLVNKDKISFLDAGCGVGDKLLVARSFPGVTAYGIENSKVFHSIANSRAGYNDRVILGDITKCDYSKYDIVYAYNPMTEAYGMEKFFQCLMDTVRPETVCIFANVGSGREALRNVNSRNERAGRKFIDIDYDKHLYKLEAS